jgi:hypothetical protein
MNHGAISKSSQLLYFNFLSFGILMQYSAFTYAENLTPLETKNISSSNFNYPKIDPVLGEHLNPIEKRLAVEIIQESKKRMLETHLLEQENPALIPQKSGCIKARFTIMHDIPKFLAQGIFIPDKSYETWIRFSTRGSDPTHANQSWDAQKILIKLNDIPGEKLSIDNSASQDFILTNTPKDLIRDPRRYLRLMNETNGVPLKKAILPFAVGVNGEIRAVDTLETTIKNPFYVRYWSLGASQLGLDTHPLAVRYSVEPCRPEIRQIHVKLTDNYLVDAINTSLTHKESCMQFLVQPRTSSKMDVEDSMIEWKESLAPFYRVATINISAQNIEDPHQLSICKNLVFSSWHTLPEHRPLGMANRLRKIIYDQMYILREKNQNPKDLKTPLM